MTSLPVEYVTFTRRTNDMLLEIETEFGMSVNLRKMKI